MVRSPYLGKKYSTPMHLNGNYLRLRKSGRRSRPQRIILFLVLIIGGLFLISLREQGKVQPLFIPTSTATRTSRSWAEEGEAQFSAGKLKEAIAAYRKATEVDTQNVDYWVALARIEIYAQVYPDALKDAETALLVAPNSAKAKAVYGWALDWNGKLDEAQAAAVQAIALDSNYAPAHAYYSEILNDAQKWQQGSNEAALALSLDPTALDAHRAMGYADESIGNYEGAIENYKNALAINPNLITLYISIGKNYRAIGDSEKAVFYFSKANAIDPDNLEPYLAISRTYYQIDEFGTAAQYLQSALERDPANPDIHGRLGLIYFHAKNYEGAEPELLLAVFGGTTEDGVQVPPLELKDSSKEYYYTLGNLWAANYKCGPDQAPALLNQVLAKFPDNPSVIASYDESMTICRNFLTPTPELLLTTTPTP